MIQRVAYPLQNTKDKIIESIKLISGGKQVSNKGLKTKPLWYMASLNVMHIDAESLTSNYFSSRLMAILLTCGFIMSIFSPLK